MKVLTYEYDKMIRVGKILNELEVHGVNQARILAELGNILDSGTPGEIAEKKEEASEDGIRSEKVQSN